MTAFNYSKRSPKLFAIIAGASLLSLAACQNADKDSADNAEDYAVAEDSAEMAAPSADSTGETAPKTEKEASSALPKLDKIPVTLPQLAYIYDYSFRSPADVVGKLQRRHAALCEEQGPANCQIIGMTKTGNEEDGITAELQMAVASKRARAFGLLLEDEARDLDAEQLSAEVESEELSKRIVDSEAQLKSRVALRDRLEQVLKTRKGSVEELVEAERSVAEVNQEIDQTRSWLKEMEGRVAYSQVNVHYDGGAAATSDFARPISGVVGSLGTIFGYVFALLILLAAIGLPIAGSVWGVRELSRRVGSKSATGG